MPELISGDFKNYLAHHVRGRVPFTDLDVSVGELLRLAESGLAELMRVRDLNGFAITNVSIVRRDEIKWDAWFAASDLPDEQHEMRGWFTQAESDDA